MTADAQTILVVDDESEMRSFHKILLESEGFSVLEAKNGRDALDVIAANDSHVDAVLSDIMMPEMNGYELCKEIKTTKETEDLPFVFISSLASLDEKTKGYSYGADEYAIKPLEANELKIKIQNLIRIRNSKTELSKQVEESRNTTMQIMNFYSDLGHVLEFYKKSIDAKSLPDLAKLVFKVTEMYGLSCSLQVLDDDGVVNYGDKGEISPLEANVIELARQKERFYTFGSRLVINFKKFSLLVKNMPVKDEERCGNLRDSLGVLCNAIEARIDSLSTIKIDHKKNEIAEFVKEILDQTQFTFESIEKENVEAIEQLMENMENSFMSLGLSDEQEDNIRQVVEICMARTNDSFQRSQQVNAMFEEINDKLIEMTNMSK